MGRVKGKTTVGEIELKLESSSVCIKEFLKVGSEEKLACGVHARGL